MHYELMLAARKALAEQYERRYPIAYENVEFVPPADGSQWLAFHYKEVDTAYLSLDRKCRSFIGMVQVNIVFAPGSGTDKARRLAKDIADFFEDGKMLDVGYIFEGGEVRPIQKSETGWLVPVRFSVRVEEKRI
ncbi:hypothetical protein [Escherichia phage vB_EcoS_PHB17]|uniref:Tail protein n=1 Tax=Escherichia phage vB_EcoS_PHB17 TaxID=2591407 RepID=A0A514DKU6_9CAUD|nr:tail terminator [Escherichia phage vB_EcoS_PHB17]QDH94243.1 hypothetical protein [Escherichia phage vB_EcoS_PHB17]